MACTNSRVMLCIYIYILASFALVSPFLLPASRSRLLPLRGCQIPPDHLAIDPRYCYCCYDFDSSDCDGSGLFSCLCSGGGLGFGSDCGNGLDSGYYFDFDSEIVVSFASLGHVSDVSCPLMTCSSSVCPSYSFASACHTTTTTMRHSYYRVSETVTGLGGHYQKLHPFLSLLSAHHFASSKPGASSPSPAPWAWFLLLVLMLVPMLAPPPVLLRRRPPGNTH